jgi:hypothetical protein
MDFEWMREQGWRRFGWYVWDQGSGMPGDWNGRLAPSFEFVWHFNREFRQACEGSGVSKKHGKREGTAHKGGKGMRGADACGEGREQREFTECRVQSRATKHDQRNSVVRIRQDARDRTAG